MIIFYLKKSVAIDVCGAGQGSTRSDVAPSSQEAHDEEESLHQSLRRVHQSQEPSKEVYRLVDRYQRPRWAGGNGLMSVFQGCSQKCTKGGD